MTADLLLPPGLYRFVGSRTGLVKELYALQPSRSGPQMIKTTANTADFGHLIDRSGSENMGISGKGQTLAASLTSCVGEAVERYCLLFPHEDLLQVSTYRDIDADKTSVPFEYFNLHAKEQLERHHQINPVRRDIDMTWCQVTNLLTGDEVFLPAELILYDVPENYPSSYVGTTNGSAAGPSLSAAIVAGFLEYVERDAIMRTWYMQKTPPEISLDRYPDVYAEIANQFATDALDVHLFAPESPLPIPIVGCALVDRRERIPRFVVGGGAALTYRDAIVDALIEAAQCRPYVQHLVREYEDRLGTIGDRHIDNLDENVLRYALPDHFEDVSFLLEGEPIEPLAAEATDAERRNTENRSTTADSTRDDLERLLSICRENDLTPLALELTTRDVREAGLSVATVAVPELIPLSLPSLPFANHPAVRERPVTTTPHPFP